MAAEEQSEAPWDVDTVYRKINPKGRWQIGSYLLLCGMYTTLAFHYMVFVFQVDTPAYHCIIPVNATKNETIPQVLEDGQWVDDRCRVYVNRSVSNATVKCEEWQFDPNSGYISTIVTDFKLVCGRNILVEIQLMISNLVLAVCQVFATKLADSYGRKPVFLIAIALRLMFGVAKAFAPNMLAYIILDALIHVAMTGFTATLLVMAMELFPLEHRSMAGTTLEFFWFVSLMVTSMVVYLFRDWRVLQLVTHLPLIFGIAYYWLVNESVPWLMSNKQYVKAEKVIRRGARINKVVIDDDLFQETKPLKPLTNGEIKQENEKLTASTASLKKRTINSLHGSNLSLSSAAIALGADHHSTSHIRLFLGLTASGRSCVTDVGIIGFLDRKSYGSGPIWLARASNGIHHMSNGNVVDPKDQEDTSVLDIFKSRRMLLISIVNFVLWFANSIVYTVINLTVTHLAGDRYLNFLLLSLAELPAIISFHWALNKFGRRWPICFYHVVCGIALLLTLVQVFGYNAPWLGITLNFVGKFAITASYCAILVYAPELYPTKVRSMFFGLCWFCAYIAQLVAPYCRPLELLVPGLVRGFCGCLSIVVGFMVLLLPETFMRPFPKTISEIESWTITLTNEERQRYKEMSEKQTTEENT